MNGEEFKAARIAAGFKTQQSLADSIVRNVRTIQRWEKDGPEPYAEAWIRRELDRFQKQAKRPLLI